MRHLQKNSFKECTSEKKKKLNVTNVILKSTTRKVLNDTKVFSATHSLSGGMLQFNNIYLYKCQKVVNNL